MEANMVRKKYSNGRTEIEFLVKSNYCFNDDIKSVGVKTSEIFYTGNWTGCSMRRIHDELKKKKIRYYE